MSRAHQLHLEERRRRNLRWLMPLCPSFSDLWHVLVVRLSNYMLPSNYVLPSNQGSLLLILRGGCLLLKYSNFQQIIKNSANFIKKTRTGLIRLKVASNPTLPKGQKPK